MFCYARVCSTSSEWSKSQCLYQQIGFAYDTRQKYWIIAQYLSLRDTAVYVYAVTCGLTF